MAEMASTQKVGNGKKTVLVALVATLLLGAGGFSSSFLNFWSPLKMLPSNQPAPKSQVIAAPVLVEVPRIEMTIPGTVSRSILISVVLEIADGDGATVSSNMPRIMDAFNGLVSGIDAAAYDRRGILEILRSELLSRARYILGENKVKSVLVTEFLVK